MVELVALGESDTADTDWKTNSFIHTTTVETTGRYNRSYVEII
jgi:hypothetical protein